MCWCSILPAVLLIVLAGLTCARLENEPDLDAAAASLIARYAAAPAPDEAAETDAAAGRMSGAADALSYVETVIDRQMAKSAGILSFDALLLALLAIFMSITPPVPLPVPPAMRSLVWAIALLFLTSGALCLWLFRVHWPALDVLGDLKREVETSVRLVWQRSGLIERAVRLALTGSAATFLVLTLAMARAMLRP